jgi:hypothetical protein
MRFFVGARNLLEKQGRLGVGTAVYIKSFSTKDLQGMDHLHQARKPFLLVISLVKPVGK